MKVGWGILAVLALLGLGLWFFVFNKSNPMQVVLKESELQQKMDPLFPIEKNYFFLVDVTMSDPKIQLKNGANRIHFQTNIAITLVGDNHFPGSGSISASLRYQPETASFFLDDASVDALDFEAIPPEHRDKVLEAANLAARSYLSKRPIYQLQSRTLKEKATRLILKKIEVVNQTLVISLGL